MFLLVKVRCNAFRAVMSELVLLRLGMASEVRHAAYVEVEMATAPLVTTSLLLLCSEIAIGTVSLDCMCT